MNERQHLAGHISILTATLTTVYPMEAAMPQLVEEAIIQAYAEYGWDLHSGTNFFYDDPWAAEVQGACWPTFSDIINQLDGLIASKGMGKEFEEKYRGSLVARLTNLTLGVKGQMLNTRRSLDFNSLLDRNVVLGRCHMNECWWWKVEKSEHLKSASNGKLVKVCVRGAAIEFPDGNYPDVFPQSENKRWSQEVSEAFVFCSLKLPTYIEYSKETKKFTGIIPFSQEGSTSGATEGIGNLYSYVCGKQSIFEINPELEFSAINIGKPTDIFNYSIK
ncbi:MAG: hypothetical protein RQ715_00085 [Methylococcales bacterium]|nr:hypothetical protein [Methylococcales bacterium]